jgi:hypothetical protein
MGTILGQIACHQPHPTVPPAKNLSHQSKFSNRSLARVLKPAQTRHSPKKQLSLKI